jgi:ABC-2 type transport system permease protein
MMDWQAVYVIWLRDMKRFLRDRLQIVVSSIRPVTWLFFMGYGLSPSFHNAGGANYTQFVLPGIIIMAVLFTAIQSAIGIIWDREFGFLKEVLVAPISRSSIVIGKALGGTTLSVIQGAIVLLLAPVMHIHLTLRIWAEALAIMAWVSFGLSSLGIVIAARMKSFEGFGAVMNFIVMPLFLLSGALFPLKGLPTWLYWLVRLNPVSYGVDLLRVSLLRTAQYAVSTSIFVLSAFAVSMIALAVWQFNGTET